MIRLHYKSFKMIEFKMELNCRSLEGGEASVEASSHGLPHSYELVSGWYTKRTNESQNEIGIIN